MSKILSKSELVSAKDYFAEILLSSRMLKFVNIEVKIVSGNAPSGLCIIDEYNNQNKPRSFTIEINKNQSKMEILNAVAHEMVHVKQYAKGELKFHERRNLVTFQREQYQDDDYWESLWEIEAYGREVGLYQKFRPTLKLLKKEI